MSKGASIVIKGEIFASEDLVVSGHIEGNILLDAGVLTISEGSCVVGEIAVPKAVVNGEIRGNLAATDRIDVRATAEIRGNLTAPALVVADGAQLTGRVEMPANARPRLVEPPAPESLPVAV